MKFKIEKFETEIKFCRDLQQELRFSEDEIYIVDRNIFKLYQEIFGDLKERSQIFLLEAAEKNKNLETLQQIFRFLAANDVKRSTRIIGIGGGVTTDITALAASLFKRGCRLLLIPTTLLGMVDAAIGGKTGINFSGIKNGVGSFYPAEKIMIFPEFLATISPKDSQAGMVEIVKMSFLQNSRLSQLLAENTKIEKLIEEAIRTKMEICRNDLHDRNSRRLLNLGHTFGHVLESISDYEISHGQAVAIGVRAAARLSFNKKFISEEVFQKIKIRLDQYEFAATFARKYLPNLLKNGEAALSQDKKADLGINLVLFRAANELFIFPTDKATEIIKILAGFAHEA